jgi:phosphoadenosine phosphosulfate reductase
MSDLNAKAAATRAILERVASEYSPAVFASSLAAEDMVLTDMILKSGLPIGIFSLETGRLHKETLAVIDQVKAHYGHDITLYQPRAELVDEYVSKNGLNAFYDSVEMRKACCQVRKVEPLGRALDGKKAWVTGQRRAQSTTRFDLAVQEDDAAHGMQKFNPLADWSEQDVWDYIRANEVPYNALHDRGYPSIGCAPCSRAVEPGEDERAGRWWWEGEGDRECGIHFDPRSGRMVRTREPAVAGPFDPGAPT